MRIIFCSLSLLALTTNAFAYEEGTFNCKNLGGLPDNTYKIENVAVGGASLPYVEITRFFKGREGSPAQSTIRGLATVSNSGGLEILSLASVRLEIRDGKLVNCRE
jgi:hypothetical protein